MLKIKSVVTASSEHSKYPATNLAEELFQEWTCKEPGEKTASVTLQLERAAVISGIDIGNKLSAFLEILVGLSTDSRNDFKVLLPSTILMSESDSRYDVSKGKTVHRFRVNDFLKPTSEEKWDLVKVNCFQSYNRDVRFGLSFLRFHTTEKKEESVLGRFALRDVDDTIPVGSFFAKRKEAASETIINQPKPSNTVPQVISSAPISNDNEKTKLVTPSRKMPESKTNERKTPEKQTTDRGKERKPQARKLMPERKTPTAKPKRKVDKESPTHAKNQQLANNNHQNTSVASSSNDRKPSTARTKRCKPFNRLFEDVVFALSGYQNPPRQNLRDMALSMGGKYRSDWGNGCTHLICAFPNTPKFKQVQGKGKIVSGDWIGDCHLGRHRLPWRRYAVDKADKNKYESDEEIEEELSKPSDRAYKRTKYSDSDTDEEVEPTKLPKVADRAIDDRKAIEPKSEKTEKALGTVRADDVEITGNNIENEKVTSKVENSDSSDSFPSLPDCFEDDIFFLHDELESCLKTKLYRCIIACKGIVSKDLDNKSVNYLVADVGADVEELIADHPSIMVVSPDWISEIVNSNNNTNQ